MSLPNLAGPFTPTPSTRPSSKTSIPPAGPLSSRESYRQNIRPITPADGIPWLTRALSSGARPSKLLTPTKPFIVPYFMYDVLSFHAKYIYLFLVCPLTLTKSTFYFSNSIMFLLFFFFLTLHNVLVTVYFFVNL